MYCLVRGGNYLSVSRVITKGYIPESRYYKKLWNSSFTVSDITIITDN